MKTTMKTLLLFKGVVAKDTSSKSKFIPELGIYITAEAIWAEQGIRAFYESRNDTTSNHWKKIYEEKNSTSIIEDFETYLSCLDMSYSSLIGIPKSFSQSEDVLKVHVVKGFAPSKLIHMSLKILRSDVNHSPEIIDDILCVLKDNGYSFDTRMDVVNQLVMLKIAESANLHPTDPQEFLRFVVYISTGNTSLNKTKDLIKDIRKTEFDPSELFIDFGLKELAHVYFRNKAIFLAYKRKEDDERNKVINKISKIAKGLEKVESVETLSIETEEEKIATYHRFFDTLDTYQIFNFLSSNHLSSKTLHPQPYVIGKGKVVKKYKLSDGVIANENYNLCLEYVINRFDHLKGRRIYIPKNVIYALPIDEHAYVDNIPRGTRFYGEKLSVGVTWQSHNGAKDMEVFPLQIDGNNKWNNQRDHLLKPLGVRDFVTIESKDLVTSLLVNNIDIESSEARYSLEISASRASDTSKLFNPFISLDTSTNRYQKILGLFLGVKQRQCFVLLNLDGSNIDLTGDSIFTSLPIKQIYKKWRRPFTLNKLLKHIGAEIVDRPTDAEFDLSLENMNEETILKLFEKNSWLIYDFDYKNFVRQKNISI